MTEVIKLEVTGAYKSVVWSTSEEVKDSWSWEGSGYKVNYRAWVLGLGVLFRVEP